MSKWLKSSKPFVFFSPFHFLFLSFKFYHFSKKKKKKQKKSFCDEEHIRNGKLNPKRKIRTKRKNANKKNNSIFKYILFLHLLKFRIGGDFLFFDKFEEKHLLPLSENYSNFHFYFLFLFYFYIYFIFIFFLG